MSRRVCMIVNGLLALATLTYAVLVILNLIGQAGLAFAVAGLAVAVFNVAVMRR